MTLEEKIAAMSHNRAILLRALQGLEIEGLDYLIFPDSKSIGEILLHVAGFEYLMIQSAQVAGGKSLDCDIWRELKAGFAREAGFAPPRGHGLNVYTDWLDEIRRRTLLFFSQDPGSCFIGTEDFAIGQVTDALQAKCPEDDDKCYLRLRNGVSTSFNDDGPANAQNCVDIPLLLQLHETYHRGQITLAKYFRSRLLRR